MFNNLNGILLSNDYQKRKTNKLTHDEYAEKLKGTTLFRTNSKFIGMVRILS